MSLINARLCRGSLCCLSWSSSNDSRAIGVRNSWETALVSSRWLAIKPSMRSAIWLKCPASERTVERVGNKMREPRSLSPKRCAARRMCSRSRQCGRTQKYRTMARLTPRKA
ncbi:hypothetical protein PFLmoz3_02502 [Pseudomonas fluorescens]|uniref:Uncharacterized protein n=1 Tax=Pseudomonas fluorescens TaxID=294 RepID=A0A125QIJ2_PSEFL|nr:hypothetical protein PFLmoz3_02502 [Pseudomonas fluorescens]